MLVRNKQHCWSCSLRQAPAVVPHRGTMVWQAGQAYTCSDMDLDLDLVSPAMREVLRLQRYGNKAECREKPRTCPAHHVESNLSPVTGERCAGNRTVSMRENHPWRLSK